MEKWEDLSNGEWREVVEDDKIITYYVGDGAQDGIQLSLSTTKILSIEEDGKSTACSYNADTRRVGFRNIPRAGALVKIVAE